MCKLKTRCSVIAACNAKGKFEEGESISANTALASPLLSRFDLILVLLDRQDDDWDGRLAESILDAACKSGPSSANSSAMLDGIRRLRSRRQQQQQNSTQNTEPFNSWDLLTLRAYIQVSRSRKTPNISPLAQTAISKYYQRQRNADVRDTARTTVRLLDGLVRLSQAHAKLMGRTRLISRMLVQPSFF